MKYIVIILGLCINLQANSLSYMDDVLKIGKTGRVVTAPIDDAMILLKAEKLSQIIYSTLKLNTKEQNIKALLYMATKEHRLEKYSDQFIYLNKYKKFKDGDKLLLKCLKNQACNLKEYTHLMEQSPLHITVATKYPNLSLAQINMKVGSINENIMNKYFQSTGWEKLKGEVGRNGIDGLFVKRKNGTIIDVLIVESKYNKSGLQHTKNGKQMTKEWVEAKIQALRKKYPDDQDYRAIQKYVDNDAYRAMLWNMKVEDDNIVISLKHVHDKSGKVFLSDPKGSSKMKINFNGNQNINIKSPKNDFHQQIVNWYKEEI